MKSFKKFVAEVAQPKPEEEKRFKDQHTYEVQPHPVALDHQFTGEIVGKTKQPRAADNVAGQDADDYDKAYTLKQESVELDEISPELQKRYKTKAMKQYKQSARQKEVGYGVAKPSTADKHMKTFMKRHKGIGSAIKRQGGSPMTNKDPKANSMTSKPAPYKNESADLDEISKAMAGRYLKKVPASAADAGDKTGRGGMGQAGASVDVKKDYEKQRKKGISQFLKRHRGAAMAVDKLTGKARVKATESTADDRARYDAADDKGKKKVTLPKAPWDKKKMDETTGSAVKKPVNVTGPDGKTRTVMKTTKNNRTDDRGQDQIRTREEELSAAQKKIDHNKNGKIDGQDLAMLRKKKQNESVEDLTEMKFNKGPVRLKDGKQIMVSKQDADLLNQMFKDLSAANRKKMQGVAMTDKAGFNEILGFAREAL